MRFIFASVTGQNGNIPHITTQDEDNEYHTIDFASLADVMAFVNKNGPIEIQAPSPTRKRTEPVFIWLDAEV